VIKISLTEEHLKKLLKGETVSGVNYAARVDYEVALKDIGYIPIFEAVFEAWAEFVSKLDQDNQTLQLIKFQRAMDKLSK